MQQKNKAPLNPQCTLHSRCQSEHKSPNMECINAHNCIIVNQISQYKLNKRHVFVPLCLFPSGCVHLSLWNTKTKHCIWTHVCYCMQIQKWETCAAQTLQVPLFEDATLTNFVLGIQMCFNRHHHCVCVCVFVFP